MTSRVAFKLRFARIVYKWSLIAGLVLFAGMIASLLWNVVWPVWANPNAGEEKWTLVAGLTSMVLINGAIAAVGIALIGWIVRFALTRERTLWPGRRAGED